MLRVYGRRLLMSFAEPSLMTSSIVVGTCIMSEGRWSDQTTVLPLRKYIGPWDVVPAVDSIPTDAGRRRSLTPSTLYWSYIVFIVTKPFGGFDIISSPTWKERKTVAGSPWALVIVPVCLNQKVLVEI